jgi:hypothetical protein
MGEEREFFRSGEVLVTNTRVQLGGGKTFALANVTSVSTQIIQPPAPPRSPAAGCATTLIAVGVIGALLGLVGMGGSVGGGLLVLLIFGALPIWLGVLWLRSARPKPTKPEYALMIGSASGEREGMRSADPDLIARIADAINAAIVSRG